MTRILHRRAKKPRLVRSVTVTQDQPPYFPPRLPISVLVEIGKHLINSDLRRTATFLTISSSQLYIGIIPYLYKTMTLTCTPDRPPFDSALSYIPLVEGCALWSAIRHEPTVENAEKIMHTPVGSFDPMIRTLLSCQYITLLEIYHEHLFMRVPLLHARVYSHDLFPNLEALTIRPHSSHPSNYSNDIRYPEWRVEKPNMTGFHDFSKFYLREASPQYCSIMDFVALVDQHAPSLKQITIHLYADVLYDPFLDCPHIGFLQNAAILQRLQYFDFRRSYLSHGIPVHKLIIHNSSFATFGSHSLLP